MHSDVVVQIVDARNPLLFRCTDLEDYVREVGEDKVNLLLVNKSDFLTEDQRKTWADYFNAHNIYAVFFSALAATIELDEKAGLVAPVQHMPDIQEDEEVENEPREDSDDSFVEGTEEDCEDGDQYHDLQETQVDKNDRLSEYMDDVVYNSNKKNNNVTETFSVPNEGQSSSVVPKLNDSYIVDSDNSSYYEDALSSDGCSLKEGEDGDGLNDSCDRDGSQSLYNSLNNCLQSQEVPHKEKKSSQSKESLSNQSRLVTSPALYNREELIALMSRLAPRRQLLQAHTTVGLVGYPNVGKSSTINCLMMEKKVTVSATPGKTKHFQVSFH